jgi:hypothetical protein
MRLGLKLRLTLQVAKDWSPELNNKQIKTLVKHSKWNFKAFERANRKEIK